MFDVLALFIGQMTTIECPRKWILPRLISPQYNVYGLNKLQSSVTCGFQVLVIDLIQCFSSQIFYCSIIRS